MSKTNKFILWCVLIAVTSFWMWVNVQVWLRGPLFGAQDYLNLGILSILFTILLSILAVGMVVFHSRATNIYFGLVVGATFSLLFKISNLNLVGIFALILLFFHAEDIVMGEMRERIKMNPQALLRKGLTNFIVSFFILMSFAAYQSPAIEDFKNIHRIPSSAEVFIRQIIQQFIGPQIEGGTPAQKEAVVNETSKQTISQFNTWLKPYFQYAPPALAFALFLVLWGVGWIFTWLATFLGMFIFVILKKTKFFHIEERDTKAETIVI